MNLDMDAAVGICWETPDQERMCFMADEMWARVPRAWLDNLAKAKEWIPADVPKGEKPLSGPYVLRNPVTVTAHAHVWRLTSGLHQGLALYQCRGCEETATDPAAVPKF